MIHSFVCHSFVLICLFALRQTLPTGRVLPERLSKQGGYPDPGNAAQPKQKHKTDTFSLAAQRPIKCYTQLENHLKKLSGVFCFQKQAQLIVHPPQLENVTFQFSDASLGPVHSSFLQFSSFLSHL